MSTQIIIANTIMKRMEKITKIIKKKEQNKRKNNQKIMLKAKKVKTVITQIKFKPLKRASSSRMNKVLAVTSIVTLCQVKQLMEVWLGFRPQLRKNPRNLRVATRITTIIRKRIRRREAQRLMMISRYSSTGG